MPWKPGQSGNPGGRPKEKPFRDALRMEALALARGEKANHPAGSLRANAQLLLLKGEVSAIREIADRLDGRVPQAIVGDDESDPIRYAVSDEPMDADEWARKHETSD
jgi:Family of unknown function (DUF5681)